MSRPELDRPLPTSAAAADESVLFTDLYELTMAQAYLRHGLDEATARFDVFFRKPPDYGAHQAGYCVLAGLADLVAWLERAHLSDEDEALLGTLRTAGGRPLFDRRFLAWLRDVRGMPGLTLRTVAEGRVIHAGAPFAVVEAPLPLAQLLETAVLNHLNYPTLVATRAARLRQAAGGGQVIEFGMRRGHGRAVDAGARAALVGGVDASSNTGASLRLGVTPKGTHAHSFVQAFMALGGDELDAFRAFAEAYPDDCLLLLDTVDTLGSGLPNAVTVFEELRQQGHEPLGVRLDSGDLAYLAVQVAMELDAAGFGDAAIVLSNQLDELTIWQIRQQIVEEAEGHGLEPQRVLGRLVYGVGTRLITSHGASALDGVYKLVALRRGEEWLPSAKRSDSPEKATTPGAKELHRVYDERGKATADLVTLADERLDPRAPLRLRHPVDGRARVLEPDSVGEVEPLLEDAWRGGGTRVAKASIDDLRARRERDEARLDVGVRRLRNPHRYHVSLSEALWRLKREVAGPAE